MFIRLKNAVLKLTNPIIAISWEIPYKFKLGNDMTSISHEMPYEIQIDWSRGFKFPN